MKKNKLEAEWKAWQMQMEFLSPAIRWMCRQYAVKQLVKEMREMECEGCGISSSDGNHKMFSIYKHECDGNIHKFVTLCIEGITE